MEKNIIKKQGRETFWCRTCNKRQTNVGDITHILPICDDCLNVLKVVIHGMKKEGRCKSCLGLGKYLDMKYDWHECKNCNGTGINNQ